MVYLAMIEDERGDLIENRTYHYGCMLDSVQRGDPGWDGYPSTPHEWWGYESDEDVYCHDCESVIIAGVAGERIA